MAKSQRMGGSTMKQYVSRDDQAVRHMAKCLGMDLHKDKPLLWIARSALEAPLPEGWSQAEAEDGARYFYHAESGKTSWELPSDEQYRLLFEQKKAERLRAEGGYSSDSFAMTARDASIATRRGFKVTGLSSVGGSVTPTPPGSSRSNRGRTPPTSARSAASSRESRPPSSAPTPRSGTPRGTPSPRANTAHMRAVNARVAPRDLLQAPAWQRELLQRAQTTIAQRAISAPGSKARGGAAAQGRGDRPYTAEAPTWGAAPPPPAWEVWAAAQDAAAETADAAAGGGDGLSRASSPRGAAHREAQAPPPQPQGPRTKEQQRARQVHYEDLAARLQHESQQLDSACRLKAQQLQELGEQIVKERKAADALVSDAMASGDEGSGGAGGAKKPGGGGPPGGWRNAAACAESAPSGPPAWRAAPLPSAGEKGKFLMRIDATLRKRRADLQGQLVVTEERMGDLTQYTEALMASIDLLRERRKEFLSHMREQTERSEKMEKDLRALQAYVYEELNQRERAVRQLRRHREEASAEQAEQEAIGRALLEELSEEERRTDELRAEADVAEQLHRQSHYLALRGARVRSETAGVKYGYVANQVSGWKSEFDQMLHAAQVRARQPADGTSVAMQMAAQLVAAFQANEVRNTSLLGRLIDTLNPQQAQLSRDLASLDAAETALQQAATAAAGAAAAESEPATTPAESPPASPTRSPSRLKSKLGGSANLARFGATSPSRPGRRTRSVSRDIFGSEPSQAPNILGGANYARTGQLSGGGVGTAAGGGGAHGDGSAAALRKLDDRMPGLLPGSQRAKDEQIENMDADVIAAMLAAIDRPLRQLVTLTTVTPATEVIAQLRAQHGCGDLAPLPDKHGLQILEPSLGTVHEFVDMMRLHGAWLVEEGQRREAEQEAKDEADPDAEADRRRRAGQREVLSAWCSQADPEAATVEPIELGKHVRHTLKKLSVHRGPTEGDEEEAEEEFYQRLQQISELKPRGAASTEGEAVAGGAGGVPSAPGATRRRWGTSPIAEEAEAEASSRDTGVVGMMREATGPSTTTTTSVPAPAIGGDALLPGASLQQGELV